LFYELAHRDNPVSFGSDFYSNEELIAEMTAAILCGITGIEQKTLENSAAYLKTWIARLTSDSRLLVSAASQAQKAADFNHIILEQRRTEEPTPYTLSTGWHRWSRSAYRTIQT
jgi:antirestriction protein ArdC